MSFFPVYLSGGFEYPVAMALATALGFGFGFVLERAGFGRATVLVSQFYGDDNRVLKVMFSGIVTVAVGLGVLSGVGLVDLAMLKIPETFLWPQIVGGLLLGAGFVISGYCPGTAMVSIASGHKDGWFTLGGIMLGSLAFGFAYPWVGGFYESSAMGVVQLNDLLGVSWGILALGLTAMAIGVFVLVERLEVFLAKRRHTQPPAGSLRVRHASFAAIGSVALLGAVLAMASLPVADGKTPPGLESIPQLGPGLDALDLASRLVAGESDYYVVDARDPASCAAKRIPGAMCLTEEDPDGAFLADLPGTRTLVLYGQTELTALPAGVASYRGPVAELSGGFAAFEREVLAAPPAPRTATAEALARYRLQVAMHNHFTGSKAAVAAPTVQPKAVRREVKKGGGC